MLLSLEESNDADQRGTGSITGNTVKVNICLRDNASSM
jgi:hypothetical protein